MNPVIPFKVDRLALVEDHGRDLAAMIFRSHSRQDRYIFLSFEERIRQKICSQQNMEA